MAYPRISQNRDLVSGERASLLGLFQNEIVDAITKSRKIYQPRFGSDRRQLLPLCSTPIGATVNGDICSAPKKDDARHFEVCSVPHATEVKSIRVSGCGLANTTPA